MSADLTKEPVIEGNEPSVDDKELFPSVDEPKGDSDPLLGDDSDGKDAPKPVEEEDYELEAPEGVELEQEQLAEVKAFAKELGVSKEQAQKLLAKNLELQSRFNENSMTRLDSASKEWAQQAKSDKEIGGDQFANTIEQGKSVLNKFATEDFKGILKASKLSHHPEVLRFLSRIGKAIGNDEFIGLENNTNTGKEKSFAERMYPSAKK